MNTVKIFCSYAPEDKKLIERLNMHLQALASQQVDVWYTHTILPGKDREHERDNRLRSANIILFLISPNFISSRKHHEKEVLPTMERYAKGEVEVLPIILRPVNWQNTPFGKLASLPSNGKPITDASWPTRDDAFLDVVNGINRVVQEINRRNDVESHPRSHLKNSEIPSHSYPEFGKVDDPSTHLDQIIENFRVLHLKTVKCMVLMGGKGFNIKGCESEYNKLFGDTVVFLAHYIPDSIKNNSEGFVSIIQREAAATLYLNGNFSNNFVRSILPPLAKLEKIVAHIKACIVILGLYKQKYFPLSEQSFANPTNQ